MTKLLMNALLLGSVVASVAACSSTTTRTRSTDETLTQAPYSEDRTVGSAPADQTVRSAEPVFQSHQTK